MKRNYIKLMSAVLMILLLLTATVGAAQAATTEKYTVAFEYDTSKCSLRLTVDGIVINPTEEDAKVYLVDKNHGTFEIRILPKAGYSILPMVDKETGSALTPSDTQGLLYEPPLNKDKTFTIEGVPKNYTIQERAASGQGHDSVFGTMDYEYDSDDPVFLPLPTLEGYDFIGWRISDEAGKTNVILNTISGEGVKFPTSTYPEVGDVLYAQPMWEGIPQTVTRYDYEYDPSGNTNIPVNSDNNVPYTTQWTEANGKEGITGKDGNAADNGAVFDEGGYKKYIGYYDFADYAEESKYYTVLQKVKTDHTANVVYRYYVPISYKLNYEGVDSTEGYPQSHVYNTKTSFIDRKPTRTGYDFVGWKVYIQKDGQKVDITASIGSLGYSSIENLTLQAREMVLADGNTNNEITLEAIWQAKTYDITYDWNGADEEKVAFTKVNGYVFDTELVLADPVRAGYTFLGWSLISGENNELIDSVDGKTLLVAKKYTDAITLTARWQANEYTVTFDGAGATKPGSASIKVTFDSPITLEGFVLPEKEGHKLLGFATADGTYYVSAEGKSLVAFWDIPENTTLYAKWEVLSYNVKVNATNAKIYLNDILYQGTPIAFPYGTTVNVVIEADAAYKVTAWQGAAVAHTHRFTDSFVLGAADKELTAAVLPMIVPPAFRVDYVNELFIAEQTLPDGRYQIQCGAETLSIKVVGGEIYVNEIKVTAVTVPESFFGNTVEWMMFGDATASADSDPVALQVSKRPELPKQNDHIGSIYPGSIDSIVVTGKPDAPYTYVYEFAVSLKADGTDLVWKTFADMTSPKENTYLLEGLNPGTIYYVYVRIKASEGNYPHGQVNMVTTNTTYDDYLNQRIDALQKLIEDTDGDILKALIAKAIADANALETPSATFYEDLEGIYNRVLIAVPFARQQDGRIAELLALRDALIATGEFSTESNNKINDLCSTAVSSITAAKMADEVEGFYQNAVDGMKAVKVSYLFYEQTKLTTHVGLPQGSRLFMQRISDITSLTNSIDAAIATGRLAVAGESMTLAEAVERFRSLDVMAGYTLRLTKDDLVYTYYDGTYEIRVLLPEELWGGSGLQVVYYNEKSGIEVLDTVRDGNCLVFTATHIEDFAILGDPTMNLTPFIIALGLIMACQLIAIICMLGRRVKNARRAYYHASVALPTMALTVRFQPTNGLTLSLVLGGCVVLLQIILMYLLLSTDMVHRNGRTRTAEVRREERPATAPVEDTPNSDDTQDVYAPIPSEMEEDAFEEIGDPSEDAFEDDALEALPDEAPEDAAENADSALDEDGVYVDLRTGEVFGDTDGYDDFIEPAANPRYSLPDEEDPMEEITAEDVSTDPFGAEAPAEDAEDGVIADGESWNCEGEAVEGASFEPAYEETTDTGSEGDSYPLEDDVYPLEEDDLYEFGDSVRGEPAEDIPQEEPVMGEPADDEPIDEPIQGESPAYEQSAVSEGSDENEEPNEPKHYDGYEE